MHGKYRAIHSPAFWMRFEQCLQQTAEGKRTVQAADVRMTEAIVRESGMQYDQGLDEPKIQASSRRFRARVIGS